MARFTPLLLLAFAIGSGQAYLHAAAPLGASRFTGSGSVAQQASTTSTRQSSRVVIEAKKGKPNVPITQRGNYVAQEKMQQQMANMKPEANGYPLFNLYVRTPRANMWYPCGSLKGDDRSKSLVDGWIQNGLGLGGMVKSNIDKSVAGSLFATPDTTKKLTDQIVKMYPALKDARRELTFGYKVEYDALEEKQEVTILTEDMKDSGPLAGLRKMFGGN